MAVVFGVQFSSWFMGSLAVYQDSLSYFAVLFGLNIALGIAIYVYHLFSNQRVSLTIFMEHRDRSHMVFTFSGTSHCQDGLSTNSGYPYGQSKNSSRSQKATDLMPKHGVI